MKKFLNIFMVMAMCLTTMVSFTACSDDDDDQKCGFSLGIEDLQMGGSSADYTAISDYCGQIEDAYIKALGLKSDNAIVLDGDFKTLCQQMKDKFNSATLPAAPVLSDLGSYTVTFTLRGYKLNGSDISLDKQTVVASKTFSSAQ